MKCLALRNPNERWLIDLILLFMPSTDPLERRVFGPGEDSIEVRAEHAHEFLERLQLRPHGRVHPLEEVLLGAPWLRLDPEQLDASLRYQARTSGVFQRTSVESRSF